MNRLQWKEWWRNERLAKKEEWRDIPGYEGLYQVSNLGRVKSLGRKKGFIFSKEIVLKGRPDKGGYLTVSLSGSLGTKNEKVHRLVLKSFLGESSMIVNHKNGIRHDNRVGNLEWCTKSYNAIHAYRILGSRKGGVGTGGIKNKNNRPISQYSLTGEFIKDWHSIKIATLAFGKEKSHIGSVCRGKRNHAFGYKWQYLSMDSWNV